MDTAQKTIDLVSNRTFNAPVEKVWQAWHEPELVKQWWGPDGFTALLAEMDFREGGTSLVCMSNPQFGINYSTWHYEKIVPMKEITYIHNLADEDGNAVNPADMGMPDDFPQNQRHTVTFKATGDNKTELIITEFGWTEGQMAEKSKMGMEQCLDKMAKIFT